MKRRGIEELKAELLAKLDEESDDVEYEILRSINENNEAFNQAAEAVESESRATIFLTEVMERISQIKNRKNVLAENKKVATFLKCLTAYSQKLENSKLSYAEYVTGENTKAVEELPNQGVLFRSPYMLAAVGLGVIAVMVMSNRAENLEQLENNDYNSLCTYGYNTIKCGVNKMIETTSTPESSMQRYGA